ncbi:MAG: hypothetical protein K0Q72_4079 [Armatimonadetes bacterium]|nr:hypothetical protein [Armatimonadota bacterium]
MPSSFDPGLYVDKTTWKRAVARSDVRLQWDPDHGPTGRPLRRRAIQLGLRGPVLEEYGRQAILEIEDISDFVTAQREVVRSGSLELLLTPRETAYTPVPASSAATRW